MVFCHPGDLRSRGPGSSGRWYRSRFLNQWVGDVSLARLPLASGYGRLDCSAPVVASAVYSLDDNGTTLGWATVFSSPPASYGMLPVFTGVGYRYGLSIANDNSVGANYSITFTGPDGRTSGQIISIPAKSQYVGFADTLVSIPNTPGAGTLEITPQSGQRFSVAALVFAGAAFTTFVPTTLP